MLVACLLDSVGRFGGKIAASDPAQQLSYAHLSVMARVMRRVILDESRAENVGILLPASASGLATIFGAMWAGRRAVPLNFLLQPAELKAIIDDAGLDLLITTIHFEPLTAQLPVRSVFLENIDLPRRFVAEAKEPVPPPPAANDDEVACLLYTSGTTGQPKGVCLTHRNFETNARAAIEHMRLTPDDHFLCVVPPFHIFGLSVLHMLPVILGGSVTYIPRFAPQAMYRAVADAGVTVLLAVPSMYGAMVRLKEIEPAAFAKVRIAASGGEPLPRTIYELVRARTGVTLVEGYGMTETSPIISVDLPWDHRVGTVGHAIPGVEVQLRTDVGDVVGRRGEGELYVRGPLVMKGYYHREEETAAAIDREGWMRTGDVVRIDEDGVLAITGRAKDLIIVAGENVYPREVEGVLEQHPAIAEAAVVGRPDGSRGEVVIAFVMLRPGAAATPEELRTFCRERLASFKTPREVIVREEFPRGPTGKILKRELNRTLPPQEA